VKIASKEMPTKFESLKVNFVLVKKLSRPEKLLGLSRKVPLGSILKGIP